MRLQITCPGDEEGQSIVLVVLAMSIFLIGAVGLGFDGSHLYSERQKAQLAADAAAQAAMMSIFDNTNSIATNTAKFGTGATFDCSTLPNSTPCKYASFHGFSSSNGDTITVSFPTSAPGVSLSPTSVDPTNMVRVFITRNVSTTLMRLLGPTGANISAVATAAIIDVKNPVPILVTHPSLDRAFLMGGNGLVKICGGPSRSIQVNSGAGAVPGESGDSFAPQGNGGGSTVIDLSHAGPADDGHCNTGTGADFGNWGLGLAGTIANVSTGSGSYLAKASPIEDPLAGVPAPDPTTPTAFPTPTPTALAAGTGICPASTSPQGCKVFMPGIYPTGIKVTSGMALFNPGIYYITGSQSTSGVDYGFSCSAGCSMQMVTGTTDTTTGTGWDGTDIGGGALFYLTGTSGPGASPYGGVNISAGGSVSLIGSPTTSTYDGMLFFEDRNAPALTHQLSGGGTMVLHGTIYLTNSLSVMEAHTTQYQTLTLGGSAGNNTVLEGEIIVGSLALQGTPNITMDLNPNSTLILRKVALVQ
jgi:Flp pilus assembly protein TadG